MVQVTVDLERRAVPVEQRRGERVPVPAFAALETGTRCDHNDQPFAAVANLSRSGIAVRATTPFPRGEPVDVRIGIGDAIYEFEARVVRARKRGTNVYDLGLEWVETSPQMTGFLEAVLRTVAATNLAKRLSEWKLEPRPAAGPPDAG